MQVTGMLYGSKLLQFAGFPTSEVLGPDASEEAIKALGQLGDRRAIVTLQAVIRNQQGFFLENVRRTAEAALAKLNA